MNVIEEENKKRDVLSAKPLQLSIVRRDFLTKGLMLGTGVMGLSLLGGKLPPPTPTLHAQSSLAMTDQLHACTCATDGQLFHTIRFSNSWQSSFGNVNAQESNGSNLRFSDVDCANVGDNLHVTAVDQNGISWHTIRFASSWQSSFGNVNAQESNGSSLRFSAIGAGGIV